MSAKASIGTRPKTRLLSDDDLPQKRTLRQTFLRPSGARQLDLAPDALTESFDQNQGSDETLDDDTLKPTMLPPDGLIIQPALPGSLVKPLVSNAVSFTSSEPSLFSGSQRIERDGERMVTNSDEDDDASSLEDPDDLMHRQEADVDEIAFPILGPDPPAVLSPKEVRSLHTKKLARDQARSQKDPLQMAAQSRDSFARLIDRKRKLESATADVAKFTAMLEAPDRPAEDRQESVRTKLDETLLDGFVTENQDEEEATKFREALSRTDAFQVNKVWSFFDNQVPGEWAPAIPSCGNVQDAHLRDTMMNTGSRQQAFLSGCIGQYATRKGLPSEVLTWIIDCLCCERREDLRLAYVSTLVDVGPQLGPLLTSNCISMIFGRLGATDGALDVEQEVDQSMSLNEVAPNPMRAYLLPIIILLRDTSHHTGLPARQHAICLLCRLLLDRSIIANCLHASLIEDALSNLIESATGRDGLDTNARSLSLVYTAVKDSSLRLQLLRHLPTSNNASIVFRRRLAQAFFFADKAYLQPTVNTPFSALKAIAAHLKTTSFRIRRETDFTSLAAIIGTLDIAIGSGDVSPWGSPKEDPEGGENAFNEGVDELATAIKGLSAQIVDTGALNMRRTEAKEALDGLHRRLIYTVRSEPSLKQTTQGESAKSLMSGWLKGKKLKELDDMPESDSNIADLYNT